MSKINDVVIGSYYIVQRKDKNTQNIIEQVVKIDGHGIKKSGKPTFSGYYGVNGFHEVFVFPEDLRELTPEEKTNNDAGEYWSLPQQFFQSTPEF
tara:strand:+ start:152 stop:436 length:285 start_codon:yes stop_codon:yes gene_type:complete